MDHLWSPWRMEYVQRDKKNDTCAFCEALEQEDGLNNLIVFRGESNFVILNRFPYTNGHLMVVPFKHTNSIEDLDGVSRAEMMELSSVCLSVLRELYWPQGFNIGINIGAAGGAGIREHVHLHVVPRWISDTNFMTSLGQTRVLPETLEESFHRIQGAWNSRK